ncbi:MAG: hypothetical protein JWO56_1574, partial [Acidobacteria bacterium]|nr:hypothetical protein [Acidobacteriota bacterium]
GVCTSLEYHPQDACFSDDPGASLLGAYIDLDCGRLTAGPLELSPTQFRTKYGGSGHLSPWGPERTAKFVSLLLPLAAESAEVLLIPYPSIGTDITRLAVKPGSSIRIGNMRLVDILEKNMTENPRENFELFYKLSNPNTTPPDPPLPETTLVPINACSVTNWP